LKAPCRRVASSERALFRSIPHAMADVQSLLAASTCFFAATLLGAVLAKTVEKIPGNSVSYANAFCGGMLLSVAIVHMLSESASELEGLGKTLNVALGGEGEEPFPVGYLLCGAGFLFIIAVERLVIGGHHEEDSTQESEKAVSDVPPQSTNDDLEANRNVELPPLENADYAAANISYDKSRSFTGLLPRSLSLLTPEVPRNKQNLVGMATFLGISAHSTIESIATGASPDQASFFMLMTAILAHKVLTSFAVGVALRAVSLRLWMLMILAFAMSGPIGIVIGASFASNLEGEQTAALQCVASGTLLAIGLDSMLLPSLDKKANSFMFAVVGYMSMSALAAYA